MINRDVTQKALERFLRPEFLGRVDEIITFNALTFDDFEKIARIMLDELKDGLKDKAIELVYDDSVPVYIARKTYGSKKNARGIRDCVRREVEDLLAELIVFHQDTEIKKFTITAAEKITAEIN